MPVARSPSVRRRCIFSPCVMSSFTFKEVSGSYIGDGRKQNHLKMTTIKIYNTCDKFQREGRRHLITKGLRMTSTLGIYPIQVSCKKAINNQSDIGREPSGKVCIPYTQNDNDNGKVLKPYSDATVLNHVLSFANRLLDRHPNTYPRTPMMVDRIFYLRTHFPNWTQLQVLVKLLRGVTDVTVRYRLSCIRIR